MTQINFINWRSGMNLTRIAQPLGLSVACLVCMFLLNAHDSSAQTMEQLGEVKSAHVIKLVEGEMQFLEQEMKNPVGPVTTDHNEQIIDYYKAVIRSFRTGANFKDAVMQVQHSYGSGNGASAAGFDVVPSSSVIDPAAGDIKDLQRLINQLDLFDNDDSDLDAIFNYWRTHKNQ